MSAITRTDFTRQYEHVAAIAHGAHPEYRLEFDAFVKTKLRRRAFTRAPSSASTLMASTSSVAPPVPE